MAVTTEEPILSRLDRLDNILRQLEEIRGSRRSPRSSCASTPSSGTLTSDGQASSVDFSPQSLEKHCRPIDAVIVETELKGTLIERLVHVEDRVLKVYITLKVRSIVFGSGGSVTQECDLENLTEVPEALHQLSLQLEEELGAEKKREELSAKKKDKKGGLKHFVKSCVKGTG
ncbi:hypothetical protein RJ639_014839 [Escallonia herrerae]|uniref:Uncharacterized protein n=1 Tax=Escallonia herrerae TaxID=1293975 RepID=A0AA89ANE8_9ASTE|nr:hypothetical protein RJ639_014839 [Escallonia herrerae]